jgi:hypothetical protein
MPEDCVPRCGYGKNRGRYAGDQKRAALRLRSVEPWTVTRLLHDGAADRGSGPPGVPIGAALANGPHSTVVNLDAYAVAIERRMVLVPTPCRVLARLLGSSSLHCRQPTTGTGEPADVRDADDDPSTAARRAGAVRPPPRLGGGGSPAVDDPCDRDEGAALADSRGVAGVATKRDVRQPRQPRPEQSERLGQARSDVYGRACKNDDRA